MSRWLKILAIFSAFFIVAACSGSNTPEATAKAFIEKSYAGDAEGVLALMHMPEGDKPGEKEMAEGKIKAMVAESKDTAQKKGGVKQVTVETAEINKNDPNHAKASVHIQFKDGEENDTVHLIKIDGKWKVRLTGGW